MTLEDVAETYPDLLYMDEFKEALMGVVERIGTGVPVLRPGQDH